MNFGKALLMIGALVLGTGASGNWNTTVVETDGGHRIGNPQAKATLIEFVSYTCPHCAHFTRDSEALLQLSYIGSGKMAVEIRHFVRDPVDLTVTMLANCGNADKFPRNHTAFMLTQDTWLGTARKATQGQVQRWNSGELPGRMRAIATDLGFYQTMEQRGYRRTDVDKCLADRDMAQKLATDTRADMVKYELQGTPSFVLGGELLDGVHDWKSLKPKLDTHLKAKSAK